MPRALILGAGSAIAQAVARQLASEGYDLILGARHAERLLSLAADVELRTKRTVAVAEFDALDAAALESLPERLEKEFGVYCLVVVVFGYLGDQTRATVDSVELLRILNSNFTGAALALTHLANYLEKQDGPCGIIGISSVAGDRGRQSNYAYGSAKGALTLFLQGLRNRLSMSGIHVMTVKPGYVATPMTEDLEGLFLVASPERVARDIVRAYRKKRDVVYVPWFWRYLMLIVRSVPERLFKRLKL